MQSLENEIYNEENEPLDDISFMYCDDKSDGRDFFFSVSVTQITVCVIMAALLFAMSFFGGFKEKIADGADYFQSFELTKSKIGEEISAMKDFLTNADI